MGAQARTEFVGIALGSLLALGAVDVTGKQVLDASSFFILFVLSLGESIIPILNGVHCTFSVYNYMYMLTYRSFLLAFP